MHIRHLTKGAVLSLVLAPFAHGAMDSPRTLREAQQREFIGAPRFSPDGKRILFAYTAGAGVPTQIHSIGIDGSDERTLTSDAYSAYPIGFSADGKWLVYRAERRDERGFLPRDRAERSVRIMSSKADGTEPRELASISGGDIGFDGWWSNGTQVALTKRGNGGSGAAAESSYVVSVDGSSPRALPAPQLWLRDGQIATVKSDLTRSTIIISDVDAGHPRPLTTDVRFQSRPVTSRDGKRILFTGGSVPPAPPLGMGTGVYVVNTDGTGLRQVLANAARAHNFAFSPDGSKVAFEDTRDDNTDIYVVDADGRNERRLTTDPGHDELPTWSPDSRHIGFHRDVRGIYLTNADGTGGERRIR